MRKWMRLFIRQLHFMIDKKVIFNDEVTNFLLNQTAFEGEIQY